jgi:phospholipid transport system substrate-binding protein
MLKTLSALCAAAGLCMMLAAPGARATPVTEIFIQLNVDKGYMILNSTSLSDAERREQFRALLLGLAASRRIALFTLGPFVTGAAPVDVDAFVEAFTNYSVAVYENRLDQYKGQTLKVTGSSDRAADDSVVQTELVSPKPNGPPIRIAFRVRRDENAAPTVTDMQIEGVSLAMTQRDDFTAYLQQHNGSLPELAKRLRAQSDKLVEKAETVSAGN